MTHERSPASGFSLVELQIVIVVFAIGAGMAAAFTLSTLPQIRADSQARRLVALLHFARETAVSSRRNIELRFDQGTHTATLFQHNEGVAEPLQTLAFEYDVRFQHFASTGDTPAAFGADDAIDFGDSTTLLFEPGGSFIDETGLPAHGTVFLALADSPITARAVTLTGTTARARLYRWIPAEGGGAWQTH